MATTTIGPEGLRLWTEDLTRKWERAVLIKNPQERDEKLLSVIALSHHLGERHPDLAKMYTHLCQEREKLNNIAKEQNPQQDTGTSPDSPQP